MENRNEQLDDLIDASLDYRLTGETLSQLAAHVASDSAARERFENAMRSQCVLSSGGQSLAEMAANVSLPVSTGSSLSKAVRLQTFFRRAAPVAAVLAISAASWTISGTLARRSTITEVTPVASTAQSAFANYMQIGLDEGRILRELPPLTIELQSTESGAQVVYVRRLLERAHVDDVYRVGQDETGRPIAVPMDLAALTPGQSL